MAIAKELLAELAVKVEKASAGLAKVTQKKMFGCEGFFHNGTIYALVWKTGRIAVKFRDDTMRDKAMALDGAKPWKAGDRLMKQWALLPEDVAASGAKLKKWVAAAHADAADA